jgi:hypothetical protein
MKRRQVDPIRARTETEPVPLKVPSIESTRGTIRKVSQFSNHYSVITDGIQGVKGWQPKLLFYDRTAELDKAFADGDIKPFARLASETIGGMK